MKFKRSVKLIFSCNLILSIIMVIFLSCATKDGLAIGNNIIKSEYNGKNGEMSNHLTTNNYVRDIVKHLAFKGFGELLLPLDNNSGYYNTMLSDIGSLMPYHSHVDPNVIVGALNHMIDEVNAGKTIFYDFYTDEQKRQDPGKSGQVITVDGSAGVVILSKNGETQ